MKPEPPLSSSEVYSRALAVLAASPFPMLASVDGAQPRVRPVSPVKTDVFTVYVASMRSSGKTAELDANPLVELCYMSPDHDQVRVTGRAENVVEGKTRQEIWDANPLLRAYLRSIDNPEFVLYRIAPTRVRYMREWALHYYEVEL